MVPLVAVDGIEDVLRGPVIEGDGVLAGHDGVGPVRGRGRIAGERPVGDPDGVHDVEDRGVDGDHHLAAGLAEAAVVTEARLAVRHRDQAVHVLEGPGDLRAARVVVLEDGDVDELEVRVVGRPVPDPFPELDAAAPGRREAGVRDVLEAPVAVRGVVAGPDEASPGSGREGTPRPGNPGRGC